MRARKFKTWRLLTGLALLPLCVAATLALLEAISSASRSSSVFSVETIALAGGYALWLVLWFFLPRPAKTYILGHELTHALWALLFGAKVSKLNVSRKGGSVSLTKTNLWIILSPYFFPFYTFVVIALWLLTRSFVTPVPFKPLWFFLIGFTWSFHACFTLNSLLVKQPDIQIYGRVFSYTIIYLINLLLIAAWLIFATAATAAGIYASFATHTTIFYTMLYQQAVWIFAKAVKVAKAWFD
ncbi:MAG: hypothetical protein WC340_12065 [Kiritimatiellia bacterium]